MDVKLKGWHQFEGARAFQGENPQQIKMEVVFRSSPILFEAKDFILNLYQLFILELLIFELWKRSKSTAFYNASQITPKLF